MVKKHKQKENPQTQSLLRSKRISNTKIKNYNIKKCFFGRPTRSLSQSIHQNHFKHIKQINQIIATLVLSFSRSNDTKIKYNDLLSQCGFTFLNSQKFQQKELTLQEIQKYATKHTLLYWLHYSIKQLGRERWNFREVVNLILLWFSYQNILTLDLYNFLKKQIYSQFFAEQVFKTEEISSNQEINLLILLGVEISSFEDIELVDTRQHNNVMTNTEQMITTLQMNDLSKLIG